MGMETFSYCDDCRSSLVFKHNLMFVAPCSNREELSANSQIIAVTSEKQQSSVHPR